MLESAVHPAEHRRAAAVRQPVPVRRRARQPAAHAERAHQSDQSAAADGADGGGTAQPHRPPYVARGDALLAGRRARHAGEPARSAHVREHRRRAGGGGGGGRAETNAARPQGAVRLPASELGAAQLRW